MWMSHADDGRVVAGFEQVFHGGQVLHHAREVGFGLDFADHGSRSGSAMRLATRIRLVDALAQVGKLAVLHLQTLGLAGYGEFARDLGHRLAFTFVAPK
jgi:hypothetical protein